MKLLPLLLLLTACCRCPERPGAFYFATNINGGSIYVTVSPDPDPVVVVSTNPAFWREPAAKFGRIDEERNLEYYRCLGEGSKIAIDAVMGVMRGSNDSAVVIINSTNINVITRTVPK